MRVALAVALLCAPLLAGCSGSSTTSSTVVTDRPAVAPDKGAIAGLLIDDRYRPIGDADVLLLPNGLTAHSDAEGQFTFTALEPGAYELRSGAKDHEAAPTGVDVVAGQYAEVELLARRIFSQDGDIVTTEFSVFVPCSHSTPDGTTVRDCTFDQSGDSYRPGFDSDYLSYGANVTHLVTEMLANKPASRESGAYKVVVRELGNGDYWGSKFTVDSDYIRIQLNFGNVSLDDTESRNVAWMNDKKMETVLFPQGGFKQETQTVLDAECGVDPFGTACFESRGLGVQLGVKAKFVQALFIGVPKVDVDSYAVLKAT